MTAPSLPTMLVQVYQLLEQETDETQRHRILNFYHVLLRMSDIYRQSFPNQNAELDAALRLFTQRKPDQTGIDTATISPQATAQPIPARNVVSSESTVVTQPIPAAEIPQEEKRYDAGKVPDSDKLVDTKTGSSSTTPAPNKTSKPVTATQAPEAGESKVQDAESKKKTLLEKINRLKGGEDLTKL